MSAICVRKLPLPTLPEHSLDGPFEGEELDEESQYHQNLRQHERPAQPLAGTAITTRIMIYRQADNPLVSAYP